MKVEMLKIEPFIHKKKRSSDSLNKSFNLPAIINILKCGNSWAKGELCSTILLNSPEKQIVLTALHEGTEIASFQSGNSITIQVIEGKIFFHTHSKNEFITIGETRTITEKIKYKLISPKEAVILLSIEKDIKAAKG
jgi:hypothetical protein